MTVKEGFTEVVKALGGRPGVTKEGAGFGADALKVGGRIFAMVSSRGEFVVKLPRQRVDELVAAGEGAHFDAGKGRPMKEWLALREGSRLDRVALAADAMEFVGR